jgi:hypothetical protein
VNRYRSHRYSFASMVISVSQILLIWGVMVPSYRIGFLTFGLKAHRILAWINIACFVLSFFLALLAMRKEQGSKHAAIAFVLSLFNIVACGIPIVV